MAENPARNVLNRSSHFDDLRVAIVHYWFVNRRGGERVVEALCELFPQADLFALVADRNALSPALRKHKLTTSFLQRVPGRVRLHRHLLPLYPMAVEQFDLRGYDLVISSESGPTKGVLTGPETVHICYCHTPMRYLWDFYHEYKNRSGLGWTRKAIFALTAHYIRMWDQASAARVDYFVANSENVARRIRKLYRREAEVTHPPVEMGDFKSANRHGDYYLVVGQLVNYKRVDLAIEACNKLGRRLRIVGTGEEYKRLKRMAGPTVEFLGTLSDEEVREQYAGCRALLFPGEEDFGMVPVEAQACGRPVIAFGKGGARETVAGLDDEAAAASPERATGIFFDRQTTDLLIEAMLRFETFAHRFSPEFIRANAEKFSKEKFVEKMSRFVRAKLEEHHRLSVCIEEEKQRAAVRVAV